MRDQPVGCDEHKILLTLERTPECILRVRDYMSNCCGGPATTPADTGLCPVSGTKGKPVALQTVKALLTSEALRRLNGLSHRFCPEPACEVVYFDESGVTYSNADIRVPVWQKEPIGGRIVCYCFGENEADIRREIDAKGSSEAVDRVRTHIDAGRCACEVRNPRGVCCLGDVAAAVKRVASGLARADVSGQDGSEPWKSTRRIRSANSQAEAG